MEIRDAVAIVTGASSGIGRALAETLAHRGARVVLAARSADTLHEMETMLPESLAVPTDMRKTEEVRRLVKIAKEKYGRVDILVNNAAQGLRAPIESINLDEYRRIIELNVVGTLTAMQEVIPFMREQKRGVIMNISSMTTKMVIPSVAAYVSTKSALNMLSLTAREELKGDGISVCVFYPGLTDTDFGKNALGTPYVSRNVRPGYAADTPEAVAEKIIAQIESEEAEAQM